MLSFPHAQVAVLVMLIIVPLWGFTTTIIPPIIEAYLTAWPSRAGSVRCRELVDKFSVVPVQLPNQATIIGGGRVQQIADWLKRLGMSEYAERFAENDIDFAVRQ